MSFWSWLIARRRVVSRAASARGLSRFTSIAGLGTALVAAWYWVPAAQGTSFDFPAPLDDVYIHFDFAEAAARGHPFEWIAGQGFSSGETAPAYAAVLALGWLVGFRGMWLGWFAAAVAIAALVLAWRSLARTFSRASWALVAGAVALLVACGHVAFGLLSGMELALHTLLLARAVEALASLERASSATRPRREWALGLLGALLVWTRPESLVIVGPFAVAAARSRFTRWPFASLARTIGPGLGATVVIAAINRAGSGEWQSAGALLKLLSSNPFLSDVDRARELVLNVGHFVLKVLLGTLVATPALWLVVGGLLAFGAFDRTLRDRTVALVGAAVLWMLLVSWNGAARYQNFRYYVPAVVLLLLATAHGAAALEERAKRWGPVAPLALALLAGSAFSRASLQRDFFRKAAANIHGQQVRVGELLRTKMGQDERVLVGDAGAIPYVSQHGAVDALGLGGWHAMPFARAATVGEAASAELLQRMPASERPTWLALYPNWFPGITSAFGTEVERVTIEDNVICGGPTKIVYRADFAALDRDQPPPGEVLDELDVADVVSEREHHYLAPVPRGGFPIMAVHRGDHGDVFDGGRLLPPGLADSFEAHARGDLTIVVRSDAPIDAVVESGEARATLTSAANDGWTTARVSLHVSDVVVVRAGTLPLREFHVWLVR